MSDSANARQILPSTVSSATLAGPATPSKARVSFACESCKRKKCKCAGGDPCESCQNANIRCVFDETQDKRRKVHTKRTIEDLTSINEDLTSVNEDLAFEVEVFRNLQKAIQNDTHEYTFEQIRQHASLNDIAVGLRDTIVEDGDEAESADTGRNLHESAFADPLPGQSVHQRRRAVPVGHAVDPLLRLETSSIDSMDVDRHTTEPSDGGDMRRTQQERNHYRGVVTEIQNCSDTEAQELFRQLRAPMGHNNSNNARLPIRQDGQSTFGNSRTLPEISASIRSPRNTWYEREGSGNSALLPPTSPHAAHRRATNASTPVAPASGSPPYQSGYATSSRTGPGLTQYITSAERMRRESGSFVDKASTRPP